MTIKRKPKEVWIGRKIPGLDWESIPTVDQELSQATAVEMRRLLFEIGEITIPILLQTQPLHPVTSAQLRWLSDALTAIGTGCDASQALGLKRKNRVGPRANLAAAMHVTDLRGQGLTEADALDIVSRMRPNGRGGYLLLRGSDDSMAQSLKKRLLRYKKRAKLKGEI